jgi:hypothetical protein
MPSPKISLSGMVLNGVGSPSPEKAKAFSVKIGLSPPFSAGMLATHVTTHRRRSWRPRPA